MHRQGGASFFARTVNARLMRPPGAKQGERGNQGLKGPGYGSSVLRAKTAVEEPERHTPGEDGQFDESELSQ